MRQPFRFTTRADRPCLFLEEPCNETSDSERPVVDPVNGTVSILDLYVENGKVLQLEKDIQTEADRVIDATGLVVCPGLVDLHVHLRDPGLTYKRTSLPERPPPPGGE